MRKLFSAQSVSARVISLLIVFFCGLAAASENVITGAVVDINGKPVSAAMVKFVRGDGVKGADYITVFTDDEGKFNIPKLSDTTIGDNARVWVEKIGFTQISPQKKPLSSLNKDGLIFVVKPLKNIADQVPASAWFADIENSPGKTQIQNSCTQCHQFPSAEVKEFVSILNRSEGGEGEAVRRQSWGMILRYMNSLGYTMMSPSTHARHIPWEVLNQPHMSFWNEPAMKRSLDFLTTHMSDSMNQMESYNYGASLGVVGDTLVREFQLPQNHLVRELMGMEGSPYLWGADLKTKNLLRLDPRSGEQVWYQVPYEDAVGNHTILPDKEGNVWIATIDNSLILKFNPGSEQWDVWNTSPPPNQPAMVHDIIFDHNGDLVYDDEGKFWATVISANGIASYDPKTKDVKTYPLAPPENMTPIQAMMYGGVFSSDRKHIWYTQVGAYFGSINIETKQYETVVDLPIPSGPRRLAITEDDVLWVPMFGAGQIVKYDAKRRKLLKVYDLPDTASAPYAVKWDVKRQVVWVATSNADVIYLFDPESEKFLVYPLPQKGGVLRQVSLHPETNDVVATYGTTPEYLERASMGILLHPGDYKKALKNASKTIAVTVGSDHE